MCVRKSPAIETYADVSESSTADCCRNATPGPVRRCDLASRFQCVGRPRIRSHDQPPQPAEKVAPAILIHPQMAGSGRRADHPRRWLSTLWRCDVECPGMLVATRMRVGNHYLTNG